MTRIIRLSSVFVIAVMLLSACGLNREFQVGLNYQPSTAIRSYYTPKGPLSIALAPFTDHRNEQKLLFRKYNKLGGEDFYYLRNEKLDTEFTAAVKAGLEAAGIRVIPISDWDKTIEGLAEMPVRMVLTGAIEEFSCERDIGETPLLPVLVGKAKLKVYWGNKPKRLVKEETIEADFRSEEFLFVSEAEVEHILNLIMRDLVEKIVKSKTVSEMM